MEEVHQAELVVSHDVQSARDRLDDAQTTVDSFRNEALPALRTARESLDRLFTQGDQTVDLARILEIRQRILRARWAYLDALWELNQARTELASALGDPFCAVPLAPNSAAIDDVPLH